MCRRSLLVALLPVLVTMMALAPVATAQQAEYMIGAGDILAVSVWRHADLDRNIVVRTNGLITFPPVGELMAQGMTPTALGRELTLRLRDYTRETNQVTVTIVQFNSQAIFLTGQVAMPGRYSFERLPDILQVLSEAGGPLPMADLSSVAIVRPSAAGPEVISIDLGAYMRGESADALPELRPGDTIEFPVSYGGGVTGSGNIYVLGEVNRPGAYPLTEGMDLLQVLAMAGGATREAALSDVVVVMDAGGNQVAANVDLNRITSDGAARPFRLSGGDRIVVPMEGSSIGDVLLSGAGSLLSATTRVLQGYLLYLSVDRTLEDSRLQQQLSSQTQP